MSRVPQGGDFIIRFEVLDRGRGFFRILGRRRDNEGHRVVVDELNYKTHLWGTARLNAADPYHRGIVA